jgi:hypothetical protein
MGIVECLDKETGKTWVAWFSNGPDMDWQEENLDGVKETFRILGEDNPRIDVGMPLEHVPTLAELEGGIDAFTMHRMKAGTVTERELAVNGIVHQVAGGTE